MRRVLVATIAVVLAACSSSSNRSESTEQSAAPKKAEQAPDQFHVRLETTKGNVVLEVNRDWAPRGADRFYELVEEKYFDGSRFFRVRPKFVVQFGIHKDPAVSELWRQLRMPDDPVKQKNQRGFVSFAMAGPGSRTTQVFVNLANNSQQLDSAGFAPFARVVEGMEVLENLYASYGEVQSLGGGGPDPQKIEALGDEYLQRSYPRLDRIHKATIVEYTPKQAMR